MRFLADESCDFAVVRALRRAGHDVRTVCESALGAEDAEVVRMAAEEDRLLLTEDKDFGRLVYASGHRHRGIIFLRYPISTRERICRTVVALAEQRGTSLAGRFVTVRPGRVRIL